MAQRPQFSTNLPNTFLWDIEKILALTDEQASPELKELLVRLYQNLSDMLTTLNGKDNGDYGSQEYLCGQLYFPNPNYNSSTSEVAVRRPVSRKAFFGGALPNSGTLQIPHGIEWTPTTRGVRIYATATNPGVLMIPIPYVDSTNPVTLNVDPTYVNIITITNMSAYTSTYIVYEIIEE